MIFRRKTLKKAAPSKAQIVATIGPASSNDATFFAMVEHQTDVARLNFSWGDYAEKSSQIAVVRAAERKFGRRIPIIADLPGPRVKLGAGHAYDPNLPALTDRDIEHMKFGIEQNVDYFALSFVGSVRDVRNARAELDRLGGTQCLIAKIERKAALEDAKRIIDAADAVMVARGDLGNEIPLERVPFAQAEIISLANAAQKPVITATEMLLSMKTASRPTRAEVTDVANAILQGSDAVMLSEETSIGNHPAETVAMMERIVLEAERHIRDRSFNHLLPL